MLLGPPAARSAILFEDDFNQGIPGWTAVKPKGVYWNGPLRWEYDLVHKAIVERSNIYTDYPLISPSAVAPMLINGTIAQAPFTYSARMTAGDCDAFGLVFGYQNETNFYRLYFSGLSRAGFPYRGCTVDRKTNGVWNTLTTPSIAFLYTTGRTFDVTLSVDDLNRATVQIVDDPLGAPTSYMTIRDLPLPTSPNGKIGVMTWGMGGYYPRGFRIQNLVLNPPGLQGDLYGMTNWTPVIPPKANGDAALFGGIREASWFFSANEYGPGGTLTEDSDSYAGSNKVNPADFTGPTLVAGDHTWSNYVVAARIVPHDMQGQGLILRYQDPSNFYRIALAFPEYEPDDLPGGAIGLPGGLSVQKNVNRVYTQIHRDDPVKYTPRLNIPYDLVAQIATNTLNILLVADPDGAPQSYTYGPFHIDGVERGKIGLFSWASLGVEFDRVSVHDGAPLYVSSALGSPSPGRGLTGFEAGQRVNASAGVVSNPPGIRHSVTGWLGSGSVPASGTGSNVVFDIDSLSALQWLWKTEYRLSISNALNGTVIYPPGDWWPAGTNVEITGQPAPGYMFDGWEGDLQSQDCTLRVVMDRPLSLQARFTADSDGDGLPDEWELSYWGNLGQGPADDSDGDGRSNLQEWNNGTDPTSADMLRIECVQTRTHNKPLLTVQNNSGARYDVESCSTLVGAWTTVATNQQADAIPISATSEMNTFLRLAQPQKPAAVPPFAPGSWTLAILPDTQNYAARRPELFNDQTRWIAANKDRYNIKYVLHLGDIVDSDASNQWNAASVALSLLDGVVPYAIAPGNHDYSAFWPVRTTLINSYFPPSRFQAWPTFGGVKEDGKIENSYHLFSAGGADWLVLALEWSPRNATIAWANSIVDRYPDRRVILITHAFLYSDDTRYDWTAKSTNQWWNPHAYSCDYDSDGANDGEELWQKLVKLHPYFTFVFNGHVVNGCAARLASTNDAGHVVHQLLANYQTQALGGGAFLRLLEFRPDGKTVQVKTFSPFSGTYLTDFRNQFMLNLNPPLR